jgi:myosin heavy subunit
VRSYNSSRFGKYVEVVLDASGDVIGSTIASYLLEKTRVVAQSRNERSYHSFYQLLLGFEREEFLELGDGPNDTAEVVAAAAFKWEDFLPKGKAAETTFKYLSNGLRRVPGVDDGADFGQLIEAMRLFVPETTIRLVMRLLTAILHIGNVKFVGICWRVFSRRSVRRCHFSRLCFHPL